MDTNVNAAGPQLAEYIELIPLLEQVRHTFPTVSSLNWFIRSHRPELVRRGTFIVVNRRLRFHPVRFQQAVREIGESIAAKGTQ